MGLNISIYVKKQAEGFGNDGMNPKGTTKEIEADFFQFLHEKFPKGGFGGGWVGEYKGGSGWPFNGKPHYQFNVRMFRYGGVFQENGYEEKDMWLAMTEYIYSHFSHMEGIEMITSWSG